MMDLIYRLSRYLGEHRINASGIKITIEFTDPEAQDRAEFMLRTHGMEGPGIVDRQMVNAICDGRPWTMFGIHFQVKAFGPLPFRRDNAKCGCPACQLARTAPARS